MFMFVLLEVVFLLIGLLQYGIDKRQVVIGQLWLASAIAGAVSLLMVSNLNFQQIITIFVGISYAIVFWIVFSNLIFSYIRGYVVKNNVSGWNRFTSQFLVMGILAFLLISFFITYFSPLAANPLVGKLNFFLSLLFMYLAFQATSFLLYSQLYTALLRVDYPNFIIVLGEKLVDNQLSLSLRNRLDRAFEIFEDANRTPIIIVSGGQTDQSYSSESSVMKAYLVEGGIPAELIIEENQSLDTRENLRFSKNILEDLSVDGSGVFVTSDYHIFRSALVAKDIQLDANGAGAKSDNHGIFGYIFAKYIREFYGYMSLHLWTHVAVAIFFAILAWVV